MPDTDGSTPTPSTALATSTEGLPEDHSRFVRLAPGRLWMQDLGPRHGGGAYVHRAEDLVAEPPLVLLHSMLVTSWDFRFIAEPLAAAGRRVLAPDLLGCGNSDRPAPADAAGYGFEWHAELLHRALERLGLHTIDLLGHGYGGAVALHLARRIEHARGSSLRLRRLILVAPHCLPVEAPIALPGPMPRMRRAWRWVGFSPLVFRTVFPRAALRRFLTRSLSTVELLESAELCDDVDVYWDRLCRDGGLDAVEAMIAQIDALHDNPPDGVRERLHVAMQSIRTPTMFVWGDRDTIVPTELAERTAALMPDAELRIIEGCGHAPHRERPQALLRALEGFERKIR